MKKLITTLFIASAFTFSFAEDDPTEDSTTDTSNRITITSTTTIDSDFVGDAITIPDEATYGLTVTFDGATLSGDDSGDATLYNKDSGSKITISGETVINASGDSYAIYISGNNTTFNINDTLTVNGDWASNYYNSDAAVYLNSGGTLILNGKYVVESTLVLSGTLKVGTTGSLVIQSRSNADTAADTFVTINDGAVLLQDSGDGTYSALSTIEFFSETNWREYVQLYVLDNDALADTNLNLAAGAWNENGYSTPKLAIAFTNGTTSVSAGKVEIGSLTINNYNVVHIDLTSIDEADGDSVVMEFLVGDTSTTMTTTATTAEVSLTAFADNIFNIGTSTTLYFDGDNQLYFVVTEDGTDYYIKVSVSDVDGTDISTGGFDVVNGFLNVSAVVPEPSTYAVILAGLALGLAMYRRRK